MMPGNKEREEAGMCASRCMCSVFLRDGGVCSREFVTVAVVGREFGDSEQKKKKKKKNISAVTCFNMRLYI
jgi:hypothetical protein